MRSRKFFGVFAGLAFAVAVPSMATCPYTFDTSSIVDGQTALAKPISDNFNYILNCPNFTGNVGIGTTDPGALLDIRGSGQRMQIGDGTNQLTVGQWDGSTNRIESASRELFLTSYAGGIGLGHSGSTDMYINTTGNVGIGTTSPSAKLDVAGTTNSSGGYTQNSDIRLKSGVSPLGFGSLDVILKLQPVTFRWKAPKDDAMNGPQIGFIAQDVEKVLPTVVSVAQDTAHTKSIKYSEITVVLVKAFQEEHALVLRQLRQIALLQRANQSLSARLDRLEKNTPGKGPVVSSFVLEAEEQG